ncbi:response regulator [Catalinimonas niigatensis]|uniref:response regulator n=1 Tax=Catalinimonas niigatensis TaxID=1397264 RepID=UPI0026654197|nr:response regulator [Catalinimonas niigatensis]WPP48620.1 response regulator [Catalinimonas niigatensis]
MRSREITIYVVDDDDVFTATIAAYLRKKEYVVREFYTVHDCMQALKSEKPSLIITDYNFSSGDTVLTDGFQFYTWAKKAHKDIPFVVFSGQDDGGLVLKMVREGVRHYIVKDKDMFAELEESLAEMFGS